MSPTANFFEQLIGLAQLFMSGLYEFSSSIFWWITTPLQDIIAYYDPFNISGIFINPIVEILEPYSLLQIFLGYGIGIYLIWQLVSWIIDILP